MIACVDVHYSDPRAVVAYVTFSAWADGVAGNEYVSPIGKVASYTARSILSERVALYHAGSPTVFKAYPIFDCGRICVA